MDKKIKIYKCISILGILTCIILFIKIKTFASNYEEGVLFASILISVITFCIFNIIRERFNLLGIILDSAASFTLGNCLFNSFMERPYLFSYAPSISNTVLKNSVVFVPIFLLLIALSNNSEDILYRFQRANKTNYRRSHPSKKILTAFITTSILLISSGIFGAICRIFISSPSDPVTAVYTMINGNSILRDIWRCVSHSSAWLCWQSLISGSLFLLPCIIRKTVNRRKLIITAASPYYFVFSVIIAAVCLIFCIRSNIYQLCCRFIEGNNIFQSLFTWFKSGYSVDSPTSIETPLNRFIFYSLFIPVALAILYIWYTIRLKRHSDFLNLLYRLAVLPFYLLLALAITCTMHMYTANLCMLILVSIVFLLIITVLIIALNAFVSFASIISFINSATELGTASHLNPDDKHQRIALEVLRQEGFNDASTTLYDYKNNRS